MLSCQVWWRKQSAFIERKITLGIQATNNAAAAAAAVVTWCCRFQDLAGRFETPDSRNRWDAPLFTVRPGGQLLQRWRR
jgi:hypothetical protein